MADLKTFEETEKLIGDIDPALDVIRVSENDGSGSFKMFLGTLATWIIAQVPSGGAQTLDQTLTLGNTTDQSIIFDDGGGNTTTYSPNVIFNEGNPFKINTDNFRVWDSSDSYGMLSVDTLSGDAYIGDAFSVLGTPYVSISGASQLLQILTFGSGASASFDGGGGQVIIGSLNLTSLNASSNSLQVTPTVLQFVSANYADGLLWIDGVGGIATLGDFGGDLNSTSITVDDSGTIITHNADTGHSFTSTSIRRLLVDPDGITTDRGAMSSATAWKFGTKQTAAAVLDSSHYIEAELLGVGVVKLLIGT